MFNIVNADGRFQLKYNTFANSN